MNPAGRLVGLVTRKEIQSRERDDDRMVDILRRPPVVVYDDCTVRDAVEQMVRHEIGRLPVVSRANRELVGILTRSDILAVYSRRLHESLVVEGLASKKRKPKAEAKVPKPVEVGK